jgi:membrane fusion protein (multidrug efflux system)
LKNIPLLFSRYHEIHQRFPSHAPFPLLGRNSVNLNIPRFSLKSIPVLALAATLFLPACEKKEEPPAVRPPIPVVLGVVVQKDMPNHKEWIGNLQGTVNSLVKANVSGNIIQRYYTEGTAVKQGEPLFQIDPAPFQATLDQAKADLSTAQASATKAQQNFVRYQSLFAGKVISVEEFQNQQQTYQASVGQVAAKQAAVQSAQVNLDFTKVISPIDGLAGLANFEVGSYVGPSSSQPLTTVVAIDPIKVVFQVGQDDYISFISAGLKDPSSAAQNKKEDRAEAMRMVLSDGTLYPQKGVFRAANNQVSTQTGSITVEGLFPNPGVLLRPGLFARVQATLGMQKNALVVPIEAVITIQTVHQLAVVSDDNKVAMKNITLGPTTREEAIVLSGVDEGDKIIVQGIQKVTDGSTVMPMPSSNSAPAAAEVLSPRESKTVGTEQPAISSPSPAK